MHSRLLKKQHFLSTIYIFIFCSFCYIFTLFKQCWQFHLIMLFSCLEEKEYKNFPKVHKSASSILSWRIRCFWNCSEFKCFSPKPGCHHSTHFLMYRYRICSLVIFFFSPFLYQQSYLNLKLVLTLIITLCIKIFSSGGWCSLFNLSNLSEGTTQTSASH